MKYILPFLSVIFLLVSCMQKQEPSDAGSVNDMTTSVNYAVRGEAIVLFDDDMTAMVEEAVSKGSVQTKSEALDQTLSSIGIRSMRRLFPYAGEFEPRTRKEGLHRWYVISYAEDVPYTKAYDDLSGISGVELVEPARKIKLAEFDDLVPDLWGLYNRQSGVDINVLPVWQNYTTGNPSVIVSVVDNGVDIEHEDLAANCAVTGHYNAVDNNTLIYPGDHGTHVAGTIAAVGNNGLGVVGVAGGDSKSGKRGVTLLSCQIFKDGTSGSLGGDSAAAIKWGADHGAVISQNSWGYQADMDGDGSVSREEEQWALNSQVLKSDKDAIDYFIKYAGCDNQGNQLPNSPMKGGVVIFAAGNDGLRNGAPANYEPVIAVGAITPEGNKATFSNYGDWVDISAPGTAILSTVPGNKYEYLQGTSMACPHVSGVAALIVSYFGGNGFTNEMLKERLLEGARTDIVPSSAKIGPVLDAYGSFTCGSNAEPSEVGDFDLSVLANTLDITFTVPADSDGKPVYGFLVLYDKDKDALEAATSSDYSSVEYASIISRTASIGDKLIGTITGLDFESTYYLKAYTYTYGLNYSEPTPVTSFETTANNAPEVRTSYEGSLEIRADKSIVLPITVVEPDGHAYTVTSVPGSEAEKFTALPDGTYNLTIAGNVVEDGTYVSTIIAKDEYGLEGKLTVEYAILSNGKPEVKVTPDDILMTAKGAELTIEMSEYIMDPDGEDLKFEAIIADPKVLHINVKGSKLILTSLAYGLSDVEIVAKDARDETCRVAFKVVVKDPSDPVSVYPNPVSDFVNVGTMESSQTRIRISGSAGQIFLDSTMEVGAFNPARIDMTDYAPGTYTMMVSFGGKEYRKTVVKL